MTRQLNHSRDVTGLVLACCVIGSALAFGGVDPLTFAPVEMTIIILAVVRLWLRGWPPVPRPTLWVLGVVVAIPLLQILPLPSHLVAVISPSRVALSRDIFSSIAPMGRTLALSLNRYETGSAILRLVCYVLVFLLAFQHYHSRHEQDALVTVLILLGVFEALYGLVQYNTGWQYIFTYAKEYYTDDATGTYINRNHFAGLLEMVLPFVLARILSRRRIRESAGHSRWKEMFVSPFSSLLLRDMVIGIVIALGLLFSRSRMGIFAAMSGALLVVILAFLQTRRRSALVIGCLMLVIPAAYGMWIGLTPVVARYEVLSQSGAFEEDRLPLWRDNIVLIRDYPLLGTGLGTYRWINAHYQTYMLWEIFEHAHNDYMEFASDIGVPAAILLFGGVWLLLLRLIRQTLLLEGTRDRVLAGGCAGAMVSLLLHEITDFNLQIPANAMIFAWIVGTAAALVWKPASRVRV